MTARPLLSTRAEIILQDLEIKTKEDAVNAIQQGFLRVGKTRKYGVKTEREIHEWCGLTPPIRARAYSCVCPKCGSKLKLVASIVPVL